MTPRATLRYWIKERERIRRRRAAGDPWPWTDDPALREYRFTNVSRQFDRMTTVLRDDLTGLRGDDRLVAAVLFRAFNRLNTWQRVRDMRTIKSWDEREALRRLRAMIARGEKTCSGVWMTAGTKGSPAYRSQARAVTVAAQTVRGSKWSSSLESAFDFLTGLPMIGPFVANEITMDLAYLTDALDRATDRETFIRLGPGSVRGLRRLRGVPPGSGIEQPRPTADDWRKFNSVCTSLRQRPPLPELTLTVHDVEHCLCEYDKYARALEGGHLKNRYHHQEGER